LASGPALFQSDLTLPGLRRGKVRDIYELPVGQGMGGVGMGQDVKRLLIVASDRISAFDVVMPTPIPGKGRLLTQISVFWFRFIVRHALARTHFLSDDPAKIPELAFGGKSNSVELMGRAMVVRKCKVIPIECVVRGYLEGSGWKEYQQTGSVCGIKLPKGLKQADKLPQPIFTPATKEEQGKHDENIDYEKACGLVGEEVMERLRSLSLAIYEKAAEHALGRGIIIADTKFEFGAPLDAADDSEPMLVDEVLTPDSSRFWPADKYKPGKAQVSYDKQFLREYLEGLVAAKTWNKQAPGPALPDEVVKATQEKYAQARDRLVGMK
jgi:phosphoribosylaminoimidazole-succinocarboxamide synthase